MSPEAGIVATYQLDIAVDHGQFFLEDCDNDWEDDPLGALYNDAAFARRLGVASGVLSIFMARHWGIVRLELIVRRDPSGDDLSEWDNVVEASLEVTSGCLAAYGPESSPREQRIAVSPGTYRVRIYTGGVDTVGENMEEGQDHYRAVLWPAPYREPMLLYSTPASPW